MKRKLQARIGSMLLVFAMVLTVFPVGALAENGASIDVDLAGGAAAVTDEAPAPTEEATPAPTEEATPAPTEEATPAPTEEATPAPADEPAKAENQNDAAAARGAEDAPLDVAAGAIVIGDGTYTQGGGEAQQIPAQGLVITGTAADQTITVDPGEGKTAAFTIRDLTLTAATDVPLIDVRSGSAVITLAGTSTLTAGTVTRYSALVRVAQGQSLTLAGDGTLNLNSGEETVAAHGAAIGGSAGESGGTIQIQSGTITVNQYGPAAGIGGGGPTADASGTGDSGDITISGGTVNVTVTAADNHGGGCGIGPGLNLLTVPAVGRDGLLNTITISGGTVTAKTVSIADGANYYSGAAIGTGCMGAPDGAQSLVHITGNANVTAVSDFAAAIGSSPARVVNGGLSQDDYGAMTIRIDGNAVVNASTPFTGKYTYSGAAIGQACYNMVTTIVIDIGGSAHVTAEGGYTGAGIGGSYTYSRSAALDIAIGGSAVVDASSLYYCAGVGSGYSIDYTNARTRIRIADQADVTAKGGDYFAGAGIGAGYTDRSGDITITGTAKVTAIGGVAYPGYESQRPGAAAIGGGGTGAVAGTTTITAGTTVVAYADGSKFAIDMDLAGSGAVNVTDTVLNGRFAEGEVTPAAGSGETDAASPINLLKGEDVDAALTLPADYRAFAVTASDGADVIRVQNGENLNRYAYYTDDTGAKQLRYPLYENTSGDGYLMLTKDDLRWMPIVELTPADITVYMGGAGYDGVVDGDGNLNTSGSGLPEAGFYVELPEDLNAQLKQALNVPADQVLDLSPYLSFSNGTKTWTLQRYDGADTSIVRGKYIYRLVAAQGQDPVRMQFTDINGTVQISDSFDLSGALYSQYTMSIYPGAVQQNTVYAQIDTDKVAEAGGDVSKLSYTTYASVVLSGTLTIRGVTKNGDTVEVVDSVEKAVDQITAVLPKDTTYTINDSDVHVVDGTPSLLVDEIVSPENTPEAENYPAQLAQAALTTIGKNLQNVQYQAQYLDLVDAANGNTWIQTETAATVYWPYPAGTDRNTTFYLVHFPGLDREMEKEDIADSIQNCQAEKVDVTNTEYGISFTADSFSPFVLVWEKNTSSGGTTEQPTATPTAAPAAGTPATGDGMPVRPIAALAAGSAAALGLLIGLRRRRRAR